MKDSLVTGLRFTKIREYELAWVEADLVDAEMDTDDKVMEVDEENDAAGQRGAVALDALPVLVPPSGTAPDHATIFVNEPKLSDVGPNPPHPLTPINPNAEELLSLSSPLLMLHSPLYLAGCLPRGRPGFDSRLALRPHPVVWTAVSSAPTAQ